MGEAASRKVGDVAYAALISNPNMGDGVSLFNAAHNNISLTPGAIGVGSIGEMVLKMGTQKDAKGLRSLGIRPAYIMMPLAQETAAETFFSSTQYNDSSTDTTQNNIYAGNRFNRIYEHRLDDDAPLAWYAASGQRGLGVKVYFLNGVNSPRMISEEAFTRDAMTWKVSIDAGAKAKDWKGLYRNNGA